MEAALVGVGIGVMKPLLSKLSTLLEKEYAKFKRIRRDAQFLRDEMRSMEAALKTLADAEQLDAEVKVWRDDVRELSYDMEDSVDDFMARVDHEPDGSTGRLKKFFDKLTKLKPRIEISNEIEEIKRRLIDTSERHKRYKRPTADSSTVGVDPRQHALYEEVDKLVGIGAPKKHIIDRLEMESSSSELKVVPIVGPGGLGKTTLANQVYCTIKDQFSCSAFVSVSRNPNMEKILRDIAEGVGITNTTSYDDVRRLTDRIRKHLQDQKYFIVIDDIWDKNAWETISDALLKNNCGSRIITTTRNSEIASFSCPQGNKVYRMEPLSSADSKRLFFKRAFGSEDLCYPHLKEVSDKILEKCAGLPLAIITISSLLTDKTAEEEWNRVLTAIGSAFAKNPNAEKMTQILSLSYFDLPHNLKTCLLYLSMFPEDYIIDKQCLISRWIAEGFIHEEHGLSTYEVGEGYLNHLINRSLVQPVDVKHGQARACRVHDIVLDFITFKAIEENFVTSLDDAEHGNISHHRVRRLCARNHNKAMAATIPASLILSHVRSLNVFGYFDQNFSLDFPALRVLDLGECLYLENYHLANIEKLFLLKYLRIGDSGITELPMKIGDLQYLQTMDIQATIIRRLPPTISRLQRLAYLYVSSLAIFPDGIIGQMQSLEVLNCLGVISPKQGKSLQEIGQLTKLRTLGVAFDTLQWTGEDMMDIQSYVETLIALCTLCNLRHLHITDSCDHPVSLESLCPTTAYSLQNLHFSGCYIDKIPHWMNSHGNLRELDFHMYRLSPEDVAILGAMPALVVLKLVISYGRNGRISIHGFRNLECFNLDIRCCGTALEFQAGSMPKLEHLKLHFMAHKVECLNGAPSNLGIHHLSALTEVYVFMTERSNTADVVARLIEIAVGTLPNHPTLTVMPTNVKQRDRYECKHFAKYFESKIENGAEPEILFRRIAGEINQDAYNISMLEGAGRDK